MARKKQLKSVSTDSKTWLAQPVGFTVARHNYTVLQTRALVNVFEYLQQSVINIIRNKDRDVMDELRNYRSNAPDFLEPQHVREHCIYVDIPYSKFGVDDNHYEAMLESLKAMSSIVVELKRKGKDGEDYYMYTSLFSVFYRPNKPGEIWFQIDKEVAAEMVNTRTLGYTKYLKETVFGTQSRYTQRIYMYICSWVDAGYTPWIRLKEFRKMLKLENNEYARFCDFRQRVIQTAYTELKEKALNDETNCYFELEMRWSSGHVRRGAPDEIRFRVIPSKYGKKKLIVNAVSSEIMELADALVVEFGMTKAVAKRLCERLNENTIKGFKDEMNRIHSVFVGARKVANPTGYAYRSLKNYIDEVTGEKVAEPDLFDNPVIQYAQEVENITPSATAQPSQWDEFMNEIKSAVSKADFDTWFSPMKFKELKGESLRVGIPNRFFMEVIENQFVPMIQPIFKRVFGEEVLLEWVLEHI